MVCAVEEIEKSTLFRGKGGKCDQDGQKFNFITKCLNTFVAHWELLEDQKDLFSNAKISIHLGLENSNVLVDI